MVERGEISAAKRRVRLSSIISRYIPVEGRGNSKRALCPFHREDTPSLHISDDKGLFHCFGCGKSGDAITFLVEHGRLEWRDALRLLGIATPEAGFLARHQRPPADPRAVELWARATPVKRWPACLRVDYGDQGKLVGAVTTSDGDVRAVVTAGLNLCIGGPEDGAVKLGGARRTVGLAAYLLDAWRLHREYALPVWCVCDERRFGTVYLQPPITKIICFTRDLASLVPDMDAIERHGHAVEYVDIGGIHGRRATVPEAANPPVPAAKPDPMGRRDAAHHRIHD